MDQTIIERLNEINRVFYATTAHSFDQTRGTAWPGWERLLPHISSSTAPLTVLDVGCGNGRFGLFLTENLKQKIGYTGIDNNPALLAFAAEALQHIPELDFNLIERDFITSSINDGLYDLVAVFGVLHHIPGYENRQRIMYQLGQRVKKGGLLAFAAWQFYEFERFRERIMPWPDNLAPFVEKHDYLLDWRRGETGVRYCHYIDDAEFRQLIAVSSLGVVDTYHADGFTGTVNHYAILNNL